MYLIDTNIHAAYLLQENFEIDDLTKKYLTLYSQMKLADRVVPDFILGEFETFMIRVVPARYQLNPEEKQTLKQLALDYIQRLTDECTIVVPEVTTVHTARDIFFENAKTYYLSFFDCLTLATAQQFDYTLFTKDRRMNEVARKLELSIYQPQ
jgi:predicted nucleic acid-binding protein